MVPAADTSTILPANMEILEAFHFWCHRKILLIRWQDRVRNAYISLCMELPSIILSVSSFVNGGPLFLPRAQAASSLHSSSSGIEAAGRPFSQQISQCRLEALSRSSARAVGISTASG